MVSPKPQSPEKLSEARVLDSVEPLVTASCAVTSCSEQVIDSSEPLVPSPSGMVVFGTMWNWRKIYRRFGTVDDCIQFSEEREFIPKKKMCRIHRKEMFLSTESQFGKFRCWKSNCRNKRVSRVQGTWFENAKLPLPLVFQLMYAFSENLSYLQTKKQLSIEDETVLSSSTVGSWYSYCRETVVIYELERNQIREKIGGSGKIVLIDQLKFGKRKFNRGRQIEDHWVIAMVEDGSDDLRLKVCPDNVMSEEIFVLLIKNHVKEGSIIQTDYCQEYPSLLEHGYIHKIVNQSDPKKKVTPDGTHTQHIESQMRVLKKQFQQEHNKADFTDWLCEYSWRRNIRVNNADPFEELLKAIQHLYGINQKGLSKTNV